MTYKLYSVARSGVRNYEGQFISNKPAKDVHKALCIKWGLDGTQLDVEPVIHDPENIITSIEA